MSASQDEIPPPPPPPPSSSQTPTQQTPHTTILSGMKYKMEKGPVSITTDTNDKSKFFSSMNCRKKFTRRKIKKARTTLLMALPEDHLLNVIENVAKRCGIPSNPDLVEMINQRRCRMDSTTHPLARENEQFSLRTPAELMMLVPAYSGFYPSGKTHRTIGLKKTKVKCYNCHKTCHFAREYRTKGNQDGRRKDAWNSGNKDGRIFGKQEDSKALVTIDGEGVDLTSHSEE
ncbi:hypothetical protein Tco_0647873 [Tanacetum coccineum]